MMVNLTVIVERDDYNENKQLRLFQKSLWKVFNNEANYDAIGPSGENKASLAKIQEKSANDEFGRA